jgi:hypothetical protein
MMKVLPNNNLQPMPFSVHPNISGNANNTNKTAQTLVSSPNSSTLQGTPLSGATKRSQPQIFANNSIVSLLGILLIISVLLFVFLKFKKWYNNKR